MPPKGERRLLRRIIISSTSELLNYLRASPIIKFLKQEENELFQNAAQALADSKGIARVHVDLLYWRMRPAEQTDPGDKQ